MNGVGEKVKELDEQLRNIDEEIKNLLLGTPNVPCGTICERFFVKRLYFSPIV